MTPIRGNTGLLADGAAVEPEDRARADFYALLARLYAAPPDAGLLAALAAAPRLVPTLDQHAGRVANPFEQAWDELRTASAAASPDEIAGEFDALFVGVGKCEVNPHGSHWVTGAMMDRPLVDVRNALARLGLEALPDAAVVEDHIAALCEVMRLLIVGNERRAPSDLAVQRQFFAQHIAPWVLQFCDAASRNPVASYYRRVAQFHEQFVVIETDAFAIE